MGHGHGHSGARHVKPLAIAFGLALGYFVVEAAFAVLTGSLLLLSDAGHMLTDTAGLGLALAAILAAARASNRGQRSFGLYRLEVLAALANAVLLFGVAGYVLWRSFGRLGEPVDLPTHQMLFVAVIGLAVNLVGFFLLQDGAKDNLNMRGAYLEVVADAIGSAAVMVAAGLIIVTGWSWVDPAFAIALGVFILPRTMRLGAQALRVLLQAAPAHVDLGTVESDLRSLPGVARVHDLHIWTLTSEMDVVTAHLQMHPGADVDRVLESAQLLLLERYGLAHATLQVEPFGHAAPARWCDARARVGTGPHGHEAERGHDAEHDHLEHAPRPDPAAPSRGRHRRS